MPEIISPTEKQFSKEIAEHKVAIIRDDGVDRHIRCQRPGTRVYGFDILTWDGHLLITGDMGSWWFARTTDMFKFFRSNGHHGNSYPINPDYWSEKLLAADCSGRKDGGATEFNQDVFAKRIKHFSYEHMRSPHRIREFSSHEKRRDFLTKVKEEVISEAYNGEVAAFNAAYNYERGGEFIFADFWEVDCRSYRHHLIWCMHAIVWTIQQYDALKSVGIAK